MLDRMPVGDEFVDGRLVVECALDGKLGGFVVGAVQVFFVQVGVFDGLGVQPDQADDANLVDDLAGYDAFGDAIDYRIRRRGLHHAAQQVNGVAMFDGHFRHHHGGWADHLVTGADGKHPGVSRRLPHHVGESLAHWAVHAADQNFRHGIGILPFSGKYGGFSRFEDNVCHNMHLLS